MKLEHLAKRFRIDKPAKFRLAKHDPAECCGLSLDKTEAKVMLAEGLERLSTLQEKLYASDRRSVLIVLQAMDAAGKDGVIKHVMSGLNPQGVEVHAFKQPSEEELDHDFLWRAGKRAAGKRAHRHFQPLALRGGAGGARAPRAAGGAASAGRHRRPRHWQKRFDDIRAFEQHLARNGTLILKFFLNVSHEEQRKRFLDRIEEPGKRWKFSMSDVAERKLWPKYMAAYEDMIRATSRPEAPWYVVPADNKWFTRLVVAAVLVEALDVLKLDYPKVGGKMLKELRKARKALEAEGGKK